MRDSGGSLDFTYNSARQMFLRKSKGVRSGHTGENDETNILLNQETLDYGEMGAAGFPGDGSTKAGD